MARPKRVKKKAEGKRKKQWRMAKSLRSRLRRTEL
jgi:hypothetical protein